jgi:hypothetical protein
LPDLCQEHSQRDAITNKDKQKASRQDMLDLAWKLEIASVAKIAPSQ